MTRTNRFNKARVVEVYEDSKFVQIIGWVLFVCLFSALITIALINIQPYTVIMSAASSKAVWIYEFPIIGPFLQSLSVGVQYVAALLIWVPVQILECLWLIIAMDAKAQKSALRQSAALTDEVREMKKTGRDSRSVARRIPRIPFFFTKWAALLALGAYTFDFVVGLRAYPIWKDWDSFQMWLKSMNGIWINYSNLQDLMLMLFSFEIILILVLVVWQWISIRKDGE